MRDLLLRFLRYNQWANERLFACAEQLTPEQLHSGNLSKGTAFETLRHMLNAELSWRMTAQGEPPAPVLEQLRAIEDLPSLKARWQQEQAGMLTFVGALPDEVFERSVLHINRQRMYKLHDIFLHVVNHASNHRSELGWVFTRFEHSPGDLEYPDYLDTVPLDETPDTALRHLLTRYLRYNAWANERVIATLEQLTPDAQMGGSLSHGSAFQTLRHMLDAEVVWRHTILADNPGPDMMHVQTLDTLPAVKAFWQDERQRLFDVLASLPEETFTQARFAPWRQSNYAIRDIFPHVVNHASNHRSEIGWYLTACGRSPGELEVVDFADTPSEGAADE